MHAPEVSGLDLAGLEAVRAQLEEWLAVVRAERTRIMAGAQVRRRAWKNAIFTGPPGAGKSRAAAALARAYQELGALPFVGVYETAAAGLAGSSARETAGLVHDAAQRGAGRVLLITGAHSWRRLPDGGAPCPTMQPITAGRATAARPGSTWRSTSCATPTPTPPS